MSIKLSMGETCVGNVNLLGRGRERFRSRGIGVTMGQKMPTVTLIFIWLLLGCAKQC